MVRQISTKRTLLFNNKQLTPITPSSLAANDISDSEIDLIWQDNSSNETHFVLEKSLDGVSGWGVVVTTAPNVTSYSDTGLSSSTLYYYRVKAINAFGSSQYSNIASTTTAVSPPNAGALPYTSGGLSVPQTPYLVQFFKADGTTNFNWRMAWRSIRHYFRIRSEYCRSIPGFLCKNRRCFIRWIGRRSNVKHQFS